MRMVYKFKVTVENEDGNKCEKRLVVKSDDYVGLNRDQIKEKLLNVIAESGHIVYYERDYIRNLPMRIWHQVN